MDVLDQLIVCPVGRAVDITKDKSLYYTVNLNAVNLDELVEARVTPDEIRHAEVMRQLNRESRGYTDKHMFRNVGGLPFWVMQRDEYRKATPDEQKRFTKWFLKRYWKYYAYVDPDTI